MVVKKKQASGSKKKNSGKSTKKDQKQEIFSLGQSMDIGHVERMFLEIRKYVADTKLKRIIDASEVERITTPCIQVLISTSNISEAEGVEFSVLNPSEAFCLAMQDLGLSKELNDWRIENV